MKSNALHETTNIKPGPSLNAHVAIETDKNCAFFSRSTSSPQIVNLEFKFTCYSTNLDLANLTLTLVNL